MSSSSEKYHHGNLRLALIEAGEQLLIEKGISGLSLRETAKNAGVSHTAPYRHFKDKEALLAAIAESGFENLAKTLQSSMDNYPNDAEKQLIEASVAYMKLAVTHLEMHQLLFGSILNDEIISETMPEKKQLALNAFLKIIKNGQKQKIYKKADTLELAIAAWSMVHGYTMLLTTGHLKEAATSLMQIEKLARSIATYLVDGLGKR